MARKPDTPCAGCGTLMWSGSTSLPAGAATCQSCRRGGIGPRRVSSSIKTCAVCACILVSASKPQGEAMCTRCRKTIGRETPCIDCLGAARGIRCKPCHVTKVRSQAQGRDLDKRRELWRRRKARMAAAPGLSLHRQRLLLATWVQQRRQCAYCPELAQTVDHVIPLALGGSNHEGNLAPACRLCNSRKNDSLLIEWKHKRRVQRERVHVEPAPPRVPKGKTCPVYFPECEQCGLGFTAKTARRRFCSDLCRSRANTGARGTHECADCSTPIPNTRHKCDPCVIATRRARKRRERTAAKLRKQSSTRGADARRAA